MLVAVVVGFVAAFLGSIPVAGPISVLVLQRGLDGDRRGATAIAVGAAVAEMTYAGLAFAGMSTILVRFPIVVPIVRGVGACILFAIGMYFVVHERTEKESEVKEAPGAKWFLGLSITALNPTLLASWTMVITIMTGSGLLSPLPWDALPFALGVGCGIVAWFVLMLVGVQRFRARIRRSTLDKGVQLVGYCLMVVAVVMAARVALPFVFHGTAT
jgi:threonine/homoserine/homoserine lactone efflux protein